MEKLRKILSFIRDNATVSIAFGLALLSMAFSALGLAVEQSERILPEGFTETASGVIVGGLVVLGITMAIFRKLYKTFESDVEEIAVRVAKVELTTHNADGGAHQIITALHNRDEQSHPDMRLRIELNEQARQYLVSTVEAIRESVERIEGWVINENEDRRK